MNSPRLYRAKRVDGTGWVEGGHCVIEDRHLIIPDTASLCFDVEIVTKHDFLEGWIEVIPESVGQATGPIGKNKIDVYGGDILICKKQIDGNFIDNLIEKGFVDYKDGAFGLHRTQGYYRSFEGWFEDYEIEVIGNIHDKPELLEEQA